eukprot:UN21892
MKPRKRIDDKIHSKSRTEPKISNLSLVSPGFFFLDSLGSSLNARCGQRPTLYLRGVPKSPRCT